MDTAEAPEAAREAAPAQIAAPPAEESAWETARYGGVSDASAGDGGGGGRLVVPTFFG